VSGYKTKYALHSNKILLVNISTRQMDKKGRREREDVKNKE
jgi:hypothetical protein